MDNKFIIKKTCSIYASDIHFATMVFPFVLKELEEKVIVRTILETNMKSNILKIIDNIGIKQNQKSEIKNIDWEKCNIRKIKKILWQLEEDVKNENSTDLIVCGYNLFIEKVNKVIDLWTKNNIEKLEKSSCKINVINCYSFEENSRNNNFINSYNYVLRTAGIEEIFTEELKEAN